MTTHRLEQDLGLPTQSETLPCEMENAGQWEDLRARSEAFRRRMIAKEQAAEGSPGKAAVAIDRPEAPDPIEDEEFWDIFAPVEIDEGLRARLMKKPDAAEAAERRKAGYAKELAWKKYNAEYVKSQERTGLDSYAIDASAFRDDWNALWGSRGYGPFEANTKICSMQFTDDPAPAGASLCSTLQIFSVKVTGLGGGLQWPLDVFGMVAIRDTIDHRRNIVFDRERDNCQTLTQKDPFLVLTGPIRAVVLMDPATIEVKLVVKGTVESEDKVLSYLAVEPTCSTLLSELLNVDYPSKLSTLEFTLGRIIFSVDATIFLRVVDGSWPDGFFGRFVARTASIDQDVLLLLHSGDKIFPCTDDGNVKLSRCVASAEVSGKLKVSIEAWKVDNSAEGKDEVFMAEVVFTPKEANRSDDALDIGFCKIKVTVAWSLIWCKLA